MKILILLIAVISQLVYARSIVPGRAVTQPLDIFSRSNKELPSGDFSVMSSRYDESGTFNKDTSRVTLSKETYNTFLELSKAVYPVRRKETNGTAFHIGDNLVLTNLHILDIDYSNTKRCNSYTVDTFTGDSFTCNKVHFCSKLHDFCLIEVAPLSKSKIVKGNCFLGMCLKEWTVFLSDLPALKLQNNVSTDNTLYKDAVFTAIGNSNGDGIHLSQGKGFEFQPLWKVQNASYHTIDTFAANEYVKFWAPSTEGNSGGPLLNEDHHVVAIVKHSSADLASDDTTKTFNGGVPTNTIISLIREALRDDPETLRKFNQTVVE
jgi:hypothetical protein